MLFPRSNDSLVSFIRVNSRTHWIPAFRWMQKSSRRADRAIRKGFVPFCSANWQISERARSLTLWRSGSSEKRGTRRRRFRARNVQRRMKNTGKKNASVTSEKCEWKTATWRRSERERERARKERISRNFKPFLFQWNFHSRELFVEVTCNFWFI